MDFIAHFLSPLGGITMASDGTAIVGLWFDGQKFFADTLDKNHVVCDDLPVFCETRRWLDCFFSGVAPGFIPPILLRTTPFRRRVWEILLTIPFGQTTTYGNIAAMIARERNVRGMSAQAVGGAVAHNSISLIIPCHRVVGSDGSMTGYAGGLRRKQWLLRMERKQHAPNLWKTEE